MAIRRTAANAGRAVKYTAMEAIADLAPTSVDIFRQAKSGVEDTRNYVRSNMSKIKTHSKAALESGTLGAQFRHYLDNSVGEIRKGNLAIRNISKDMEDDFDRIMADIKADQNSDVGVSASENEETHAQRTVSAADLGVDDGMIRMMAATGTGTVEALRELQGSMTQTQLSAAEYMTNKLSTVLFTQMSMQNKHFGIIENHLGAINKNLESLVNFQAKSQQAFIHANMTFFDEMSGYISRAEKAKDDARRGAKKGKRRKLDGFLADRHMDLTQYKSIVKENLDTSEVGMAFNMMTGLDMDYIIQAIMDGVDPKKILAKAGMGMLMPKKVRRSVRRSDNMLNTMLKSGLSRLGSYQYDMKNHPFLGVLGSIFGIDTRMARQTQLGKFNHGERTWNGEAQKALVNVIPKYLAEVSANTKSQADAMKKLAQQLGIQHTGTEAAYYDMETGTYQTKAQARAMLQKRVKDAKENPFANIFNGASLDPDEIMDRDLWKGMSEKIQDQISTLMNTAVDSVDGMTTQMNQQLQDLLAKGLKRGSKDIDVDRMMAKLVQSVQQSRQNMFDLLEKIQNGEGAFGQIAPEIANELGIIEYDDLMKYLGKQSRSKEERDKTSISLRDANSGKYSIRGKNYEFMGEAGKARTKNASDMLRAFISQAENLPNSNNPAARKAGQLLQTLMYGRNRSRWANAASGGIDRVTAELFDIMMGTGKRARGSGGGGSGGGGSSGGGLPPDLGMDDYIQIAADLAQAGAGAAVGAASSSASKAKELRGKAGSSARAGIGSTINNGRRLRLVARTGAHDLAVGAVGGARDLRDAARSGAHDLAVDAVGKIKGATSSASPGEDESARSSNIVNQSFQDSANGGPDSAKTTADATSQMAGTIEETFGKKGYMARIYNSPAMKKMAEKFGKTKVGKAMKKGVDDAEHYIGSLFTEDYVDPETGEVTESIATKMRKLAAPLTGSAKNVMGIQDAVETTAQDLVEQGEKLKEGVENTTEALVGDGDAEKQKQSIFKAIGDKFRKSGTKIAAGATVGAGASILSGGTMGLLGSFFLPGGPIGSAILGSAISLAWKSETFQKVMFGEDDGDGNKVGGLISDKLQKSFKKNLPTFKTGAAVGVGLKFATGLLGIKGPLGAIGVLPGMFGPGGIMGAAIMGAAGAFILKNEKVQDILFGEEVDGKRQGAILSNAYNKYGGKLKNFILGTTGDPGLMKKLKGIGIGAAAGAAMSNMGILGSALSFGGPIGGAIVGSAVGMAAMAPKFQSYLFGDIDPNDPEGKKRKGNGLLSRVSHALDLNVIEPMSNWLSETGQQFFLFVKEKFEYPMRILLSPLKDLAEQAKDTATNAIDLMVDKVGGAVAKSAKFVIEGIGGKFFNIVLKPMAKVTGSLAKTALMGSAHIASLPLNLLAGGFEKFTKTGRKSRKAINQYTNWSSFGDLIGNRRAAAEKRGDKYGFINQMSDTIGIGLAKTPFLRRMVRNADIMMGEGGLMEGARDANSGAVREILDAKLSKFNAHKQRGELKHDVRTRKKRDKKRRKMAKELNYTRGADMSEDQYEDMVARAKDLGYDVTSRDELDDFIFDINGFNEKKKKKEARASGQLNDIADDNIADLDAHQKSRHDEVMDVLKKIATNTETAADVGKAQLDLDSGSVMDTEDIRGGGNKSSSKYSDYVDDNITKKVAAEKKASNQAAFAEALGAMNDAEDKKVRMADLRGNGTGSGRDEDVEHMKWRDAPELEEPKSLLEHVTEMLGGGGSFLGNMATGLLGGAGLAALLAELMNNEDFRTTVTDLATTAGKAALTAVATGIKTVVTGAAKAVVEIIPEAVGGAVETVKNLYNTVMGNDGGVADSRTLSTDEEGNPLETVTNEDFNKHLWQAAAHPLKTLKAIPTVSKGIATFGNTLLHPVKSAKGAFAALTGKGAQAAATSANQKGLAELIRAGVNSTDDAFKAVATNASSTVDDLIKAGLESSDDAVKAVAASAKAANENKGLIAKCINVAKKGLEWAAENNATFAKMAGGMSNVKSKLKALITASDDIVKKIIEKGLTATHSERLAAAYAEAAGTASAGAFTAGALTAVFAAAGGIDGLLSAAHLFKVDAEYVTPKMSLISAVWGAACGASGVACVVAILNDIIREYTGIDFVCMCADFLYDLIATDREEEIRDFGRQYLGSQTDVYNALNDTKLSDQAYNDMANQPWYGKIWDRFLGKDSDRVDQNKYATNALMASGESIDTEAGKAVASQASGEYQDLKQLVAWAQNVNDNYKQRNSKRQGDYVLPEVWRTSVTEDDYKLAQQILKENKDKVSFTSADNTKANGQYGNYEVPSQQIFSEFGYQKASGAANVEGSAAGTTAIGNKVSVKALEGKYPGYTTKGSAKVYKENGGVALVGTPMDSYITEVGSYKSGSTVYITATKKINNKEYGVIGPDSGNGYKANQSNYAGGITVLNPQGCLILMSDLQAEATGYGGRSKGGRRIGLGSGHFLQNDPRWGKTGIGTLPSGTRSDMATGGCGPTALANAASHLGMDLNPGEVGKFASSNGYISQGGANDGLFNEGVGKLGMTSTKLTNANDIASSLASGTPVVMSGNDTSGSTPFTKAGHVVTATGIDRSGNVTIEDPQREGQYSYKFSDVAKKMTGSWGIGAKGYGKGGKKGPVGYGLISDMFKGFSQLINWVYERFGLGKKYDENGNEITSGSSTTSNIGEEMVNGIANGATNSFVGSSWTGEPMDPDESKGRIWNYLRTKIGMSEEAASGLMGCWEAESGNRADRLEGDFLQNRVSGWPSPTQAMSSNEALNEYFTKWLAPRTKGIHPESYKGTDGNYYPGLGLAQWTGPRGENLLNFSKGLGMDWRDLYAQLNFAMDEFGKRKNSSKIFDATSPSDGAYKALIYYEMSEKWARKHPDKLQKRQNFAEAIYAAYHGTMGIGQVPERADDNFQADTDIIEPGVYVIRKNKSIYNGRGEKVMGVMKDSKLSVSGGVTINDTPYAVIVDNEGYFEPTRRTGPKNPNGYYALVSELTVDRQTTAQALQGVPVTNSMAKANDMAKNVLNGALKKVFSGTSADSTDNSEESETTGFGGRSRGGRRLGFGLLDGLSGGFSQMADIVNKYTSGGTSGGTSNGTTDATTTGGAINPNAEESDNGGQQSAGTADVAAGQKAVVDKMASIVGKLRYSRAGGEQDPDKGVASCASTVAWAYKKALGVKGMSAKSTVQCQHEDFQTIWTNNGTPLDPSILQPGDVIYQNWDQERNNGTMQHTEMYAGNNQDLSHGGKPPMGPVYKKLDASRKKHTMMVRRYKPFCDGSEFTVQDGGDAVSSGDLGGYNAQSGYTSADGTSAASTTNSAGLDTSGGFTGILQSGFEKLKDVVYKHFGVSRDSSSADTTSTSPVSATSLSYSNDGSSSYASPVSSADLSTSSEDAAPTDDSSGGSVATGKGFKPRMTRPEAGNKYYITKSAGGYSDAIPGSPTDPQNNVLHNCVGYAYGRFNEIVGSGGCNLLRPVNAENFMDYKGNLETGQDPRVGAVMVWSKGQKGNKGDGVGHVAIVEKVKSPTEIVSSESGWQAKKPFWTENRSKGDGNWGKGGQYHFQGFIYNPAKSCQPETEEEKAAREQASSRDNSAYYSTQGGQKQSQSQTVGLGGEPVGSPKSQWRGYDAKLGAFGKIFEKRDRDEEEKRRRSMLGTDPLAGIGGGDDDNCIGSVACTAHEDLDHNLPTGYGSGGGDIHSDANSAIETRMDKIINILERIAKNGEKKVAPTTNNSLNVNYGKGDGKNTVQPVVIKEAPQSGEDDSLHNYSRNMHRKIASRNRFL